MGSSLPFLVIQFLLAEFAGEFLIHYLYGAERGGGGNVATAPDKLKLARSKASMCNFREKIEWEVRHSKIVEHASAQQSDNTTLYLYAQPHWVGSGGRVVDRNFSSWRVVEGRDVVEDVGQ